MTSGRSVVLWAGLWALSCSGRYEVGEIDSNTAGSSGNSAMAGSHSGAASASSGGSAASDAGGNGETLCLSADAPGELAGEYVTPAQLWARVSPYIWGGMHPPPANLPTETSYAWAGDVVDWAFAQGAATDGVSGGSWFVRRWLQLDAEAPLEGDYDRQLARNDQTMLEALLLTSWASGHVGVFSEQSWLIERPGIPRRGVGIMATLFSLQVPPPPPSGLLDIMLDPELPDRAAVETRTALQPCYGCHAYFNGLGYALGHFDNMGDYRDLDRGQPIDVSGSFSLPERILEFDGIADFGAQAATTCDANRYIVERFLRIAVAELGYGEQQQAALDDNIERVTQGFIAGGRSYRALVRSLAQSPLGLRP